jgi:two-component system nitrogen regulation response regulator GlnG
MDGTVLIADDDRTIRTVLTQAMIRAGCKVHATSSLVTLMRWIEEGKGDLVISDVVMPDGDGLETLPKIQKLRPNLPVIIISAQNNIVTAFRANKAKAFDYLPKPFDLPELMHRSAKALEKNQAQREVSVFSNQKSSEIPLIGKSGIIQNLFKLMARTVDSITPVLVIGEPGSGKTLTAKTLHDLSKRNAMPFITLYSQMCENHDVISDTLERAKDGTLVLDGVTDLTPFGQLSLLPAVEQLGEQNTRLISIADTNILNRVKEGKFRSDLFHRISSNQLHVPALRDRLDDIHSLALNFLKKSPITSRYQLSAEGKDELCSFHWPGNVRQLKNVIEQLILEAPDHVLDGPTVNEVIAKYCQDGPLPLTQSGNELSVSVAMHVQKYFDLHSGQLPPNDVYQYFLRQIEAPLIEVALVAVAGNQSKCADLLGINRNTLRKKITEFDILVSRHRKLM